MSYQDPFQPRKNAILSMVLGLKHRTVLILILGLIFNLLLVNGAFGRYVALMIGKTDSPDPVLAGSEIIYVISYQVTAVLKDATNIVISDQLPAEVDFVSASDGGTESGGVVSWSLGDLLAGGTTKVKSGTLTLAVKVKDGVADGTVVSNTATIRTNEAGPQASTTTTTVQAPVPQVCKLELTKSVDKNSAVPGDILTWTLQYQNTGNGSCTGNGLKIQDVLSEDLIFLTGSNTQLAAGDTDGQGLDFGYESIPGYDDNLHTLSWNAHLVSPNESGTITFQTQVQQRYQCGDFSVENYFRSWSLEKDWQNSSPVVTTIIYPCPICGDGTVNQASEECDAGSQNGVVCVPDNLGCAAAQFIRGDANQDGALDIGDAVTIADYVNYQVPLTCRDAADVDDNGVVNLNDVHYLNAYLFSGGPMPGAPFPAAGLDPTADYGVSCTYCSAECKNVPVTGSTCGDKIKNGAEECDDIDGVGSHQRCTAQCTLQNLTYCGDGSAQAPNDNGQNEQCDDGNGNDGDGCSASCTIEQRGCTDNCGGGPSAGSGSASGGGGAPIFNPRLLMPKTVNQVFVYPGEEVIYTLKITNIGNLAGKNLTVTDALPTGFSYATTSQNLVIFDLGDIGIYETKEITYTVKVGATVAPGIYENNALAKVTNGGRPNNEALASVKVEVRARTTGPAQPILSLEKSHEKPYANPGDLVTYIITIANAGDGVAKDVKINDLLPAGFTAFGGVAEWNIGEIAPGEIKRLEAKVAVGEMVVVGQYENTAVLTAANHPNLEATDILEVRFGQILGEELPDTGPGGQLIFYFLANLTAILASAYIISEERRLSCRIFHLV